MPAVDPSLVAQHPEFFFADGSVVFIVGSGPAFAFHLHRGLVYRWSPRFRAILDAMDAATDPLTFKGHAAVELDDNALDFDRLVRVMYDGTASLPQKCTLQSFPHLASLLLLSHKYGITHLFDSARVVLLAAYPFTLAAWDAREAYDFTIRNRLDAVRAHAPPLGVVSLALQLDAPHLLVPAYLDLARRPASEIIRGFATTTPIANSPAGFTLHLKHAQTTAVLRGKETLQRFIADFIKTDVERRAPAAQCRYLDTQGVSVCAEAFARVAHEMLVMTADVTGGVDSDPLFVLSCAVAILESGKVPRACTVCVEGFRRSIYVARQHVWGCLDKWFGLRDVLEKGFDAGGWD